MGSANLITVCLLLVYETVCRAKLTVGLESASRRRWLIFWLLEMIQCMLITRPSCHEAVGMAVELEVTTLPSR